VTLPTNDAADPPRAVPALDAPELTKCLTATYALGWASLLTMACACAAIPPARWFAEHALAVDIHGHVRAAEPRGLGTFTSLLTTNLRATGWPLVPAALGAQRSSTVRRIVHAAALLSLATNMLPAGAALGVYRWTLVPYLPHLPLELYAITAGPTSWLLVSRGRCSRRQLLPIAASICATLAGAAFLETWATPGR
jgi:hypothetical protein